jgi:hypothetical protein
MMTEHDTSNIHSKKNHRPRNGSKCRARIALALLTAVWLWACNSDGRPVFDKTMPPNQRIALLDGGPHVGRADTGTTVVAYEYTRQPSPASEVVVHVKGQILDVRISSTSVNIYLLALEGNGNVLLRKLLYASGFKSSSVYFRRSSSFDKTLTLPPETQALAIDSETRASRGRR